MKRTRKMLMTVVLSLVLLLGVPVYAADLLGHPQLSEVLLYHVVSGKVMSTDLQNGMTAATLSGQTITVDLTNGVKLNSSSVTTADIQATNGVIHVIDTVLVPQNFVYQAAVADNDVPQTSVPGLAPFAIAGIIALAGAVGLSRKRMK